MVCLNRPYYFKFFYMLDRTNFTWYFLEHIVQNLKKVSCNTFKNIMKIFEESSLNFASTIKQTQAN